MDPSTIGQAECPIRFICSGGDQPWVGWLFVAWMAVLTVAGFVGIGVDRRRARQDT